VGALGSSWLSLSLGAGFSASGMMLLRPVEACNARTAVAWRAVSCGAAAALATMPLAGDWARSGVRIARRRSALLVREAGRIVDVDVDVDVCVCACLCLCPAEWWQSRVALYTQ
jgi:hypothetical protein